MTATDVLRRMLDERGVEWTYEDGTVSFNDGKRWFHAWAYNDGAMCVSMGYLTPAQAIAATLGRSNVGRYVGLRQGKYWERTENSNYYCGGCGWKVTDHDSYCPECGGALHEYALGTETCHLRPWKMEHDTGFYDCMECSECGYVTDVSEWAKATYCAGCGRRIEQ